MRGNTALALILDANRAGDFSNSPLYHAELILEEILCKRTKIVIGGKLLKELAETKIRSLLVEWTKRGSVLRFDDDLVDAETIRLSQQAIRSNDPHVLALAKISGCLLLYTWDRDLIDDFKDSKIIQPRGKIIHPPTRHAVAKRLLQRYGN